MRWTSHNPICSCLACSICLLPVWSFGVLIGVPSACVPQELFVDV